MDANLKELNKKRLAHFLSLGVAKAPAQKEIEKSESNEVIDLIDDSDEDDTVSPFAANEKPAAVKRRNNDTKSAAGKGTIVNQQPSSKRIKRDIKFQVATWNVWFGPEGEGSPHPSVRMRTLCKHLLEPSANLLFIGFQEVVGQLWDSCIKSHLSKSYQLYRQTGYPYGCAIAVHSSVEVLEQGFVPYSQTDMGRGILYVLANLPYGAGTVLFTTTHLESFASPQSTGSPQRAHQCRQLRDFCVSNGFPSIVTGDMNWDDYLAPKSRRKLQDSASMMSIFNEKGSEWKDSWLNLHPHDPGYTYDSKLNPMLKGNLCRRFDRCIVHDLTCLEAELLGTEQIGDLKFEKHNPFTHQTSLRPLAPSDHFGYRVTLQMA